jgi:uncharacterized membrane protein
MIARGISKLIFGLVLIPSAIYAFYDIHHKFTFQGVGDTFVSILITISIIITIIVGVYLILGGIANLKGTPTSGPERERRPNSPL